MIGKVGLALVAFLVGVGVATGAPPAWRVVASGTGTGSFAIANVSASIDNPNAVAVRSTAGAAEINWSLICSGEINAARNVIYALTTPRADDCTVTALGSGRGRVRVQVLKR